MLDIIRAGRVAVVAAALLVAPIAAMSPASAQPAPCQLDGVDIGTMPIVLTDDIVTRAIAAIPGFVAASDTVAARYGIDIMGDSAAVCTALAANPQAIAEMSASVEPHGFAIGDFLATFATITRAFVVAAGMVPAAQAAALPGAPDEATVAVVAARLPEILAAMMSAGLLVP